MRCARLPRRGNPWAHKALFGAGRMAQSPKPFTASHHNTNLMIFSLPPSLPSPQHQSSNLPLTPSLTALPTTPIF